MPPNDNDPSAAVDAAQKLKTALEEAPLNIVKSRTLYTARIRSEIEARASGEDSDSLPITFGENSKLVDPAVISLDTAAQLSFFSKLKFQYREQKAKDQYIKIIVSDDAPDISAQDNERLRLSNEKKKEELKEAKLRLAETHNNLKTLAPLVEQDYIKAKALTSEAAELAQKVLDARLQLIRLRKKHPHPRLTISSADAQLDAQVVEMQKLSDNLEEMNENVERVKVKVKEGARDVERLRVERAEVEKQVKAAQSEAEDDRVVSLYDWYTATLALHRDMFSLDSFIAPSENELKLTYSLEPSTASSKLRRVTITLLFVPNTRRLADAQVEGLTTDVGDVVDTHVQANDVSGLLAALLARARTRS